MNFLRNRDAHIRLFQRRRHPHNVPHVMLVLNRQLRWLAGLTLLGLLLGAATAEAQDRDAARARVEDFLRKGDYTSAEIVVRGLMNQEQQPSEYANLQLQLASILLLRGNLSQALALCEIAVRGLQGTKASSLSIGSALQLLGTIRYKARDFDGALEAYSQALSLLRSALSGVHPKIGEVLEDLATVYTAQSRCGEAEKALLEAQAVYRRVLDPDDLRLAEVLRSLGIARDCSGDKTGAARYYAQSDEIVSQVNAKCSRQQDPLCSRAADLAAESRRRQQSRP
jgi:tetratricopeptide (TPR) repeat protein